MILICENAAWIENDIKVVTANSHVYWDTLYIEKTVELEDDIKALNVYCI